MMRSAAKYLAIVIVLLSVSRASAEAIAHFETRFDTDWTIAGISGLRGLGMGNIALSGTSGTLTKAYLYWHGPLNDGFSNAAVTFAGNAVVGTDIGASADNAWGFDLSRAYRADVTGLVAGDGLYSFSIPTTGNQQINGASLVVFFNDGNSANNRDVVLFDGNDSNTFNVFDTTGWTASLSGINYAGGTSALAFIVSDGQDFVPLDDSGVDINGSELFPSGDNFNGNTLADAGGGVSNGDVWDHRVEDITSFLSLGPNSLLLQPNPLAPPQDFLSLVVLAIDLPAGAAPPVPEPSAIAIAVSGLLTLAAAEMKRRRRRQRPAAR